MKNSIVLLPMVLLLGSCTYQPQPTGDGRADTGPAISVPELKEHVYHLASDELEGRKPGTEGGSKAAEYIRAEFIRYGLVMLGDHGYQPFDVTTSVSLGEGNALNVAGAVATADSEYTPLAFSADGDLNAQVAFVGYGFAIEEDSLSWLDYADIDVRDRWVMVLRGDPDPSNPHSTFAMHSDLRHKVLTAQDKGAAGILFVSGAEFDPEDALIPLYYDQSKSRAQIPALNIKRVIADKLLESTGNTIADLEKQIMEERRSQSFAIDKSVTASVRVVQNQVSTSNVVAFLEGSDRKLREDVIVIGAHYDHLGYGGPHSGSRRPDTVAIHNGADDNASGVAALLEMAQYLSDRSDQLRRSVLFIAFSAEEMGVIGSKYFVNDCPIDRSRIKYMLNLDMVGRYDEDKDALRIGGTGTAWGMEDYLKMIALRHGVPLEMSPEGFGPSDHASFYVEDIPVLFFFTGAHDQYHTPEDDADLVLYDGMETIASFVADVTMALASRGTTMAFQEAGPKEQQAARTRLRVTLGIMPDYGASEGTEGLRVDAVLDDRPAKRAGMLKGDVIVAVEGKQVTNIYDYMYRLAELRPGQRATVDVMRSGAKVVLIVDL
ncbi:MAG TPA: M20/M25/M40 family metallo-hydrolase [candidate division Zixibacteria bacterium]